MKFKLEIEMGNAAMRTKNHLCQALRQVATRFISCWYPVAKGESHTIQDANGNTVGRWTFEE
jgi:hypothetical protein